MPTFKITDGINAPIEVVPCEDSALLKYFRSLSNFSVNGALLALRSGVTLADPSIKTITVGIDFSQPIDIGISQVDLKIGGGTSGSLGIFKPESGGACLFDPDPYGDPIPVAPDDRYVSFGVSATVNAAAAAGGGDLHFGFSAETSVSAANYRRFTIRPSAPEITDAIKSTVAGFVLPCDIEDLLDMPVDSIITLEGAGALKFSGTADLLAAANPLASVSLPAPLPFVSLKSGGAIRVGADFEITGEYQIRLMKTRPQRFRLAYYLKSGEEFSIRAAASAGLSANVGTRDLLSTLIAAISSDAKADAEELSSVGLRADEIQAIEEAIKGSIQRSLEIAVATELGSRRAQTAAFVYDIDLAALTPVSRDAVDSALHGNLSALTRDPESHLPGILIVHDIFANLRERRHSLSINLLGIVNYGRVSKLVLAGKTMFEPITGHLVICDTATASRIAGTGVNVGVADADKLRQVMAENFLITVAYRGAKATGLAPDLATTQSFFALHQHTSPEIVRNELNVSVALGMMNTEEADKVSRSAADFGRTLFYAKADYDHDLSVQLFLENNQPRPVEFYEKAGLQAVASLVRRGDADEARLRPIQDESLWQEMKSSGQPGIKKLFPGIPDSVVGAIISDYSLIRWWADTMNATGKKLAEMEAFLASRTTADEDDSDFKKLRTELAKHLQSVAANTRESFGRPWGLLAVFNASGKRAPRKSTLIGSKLSLASVS